MSLPRLNLQSAGWIVFQDFDASDPFGTAYDRTNYSGTTLPILYGARFGWVTGADGIPVFQQIASTQGIVSGFFFCPPTGSRVQGQWAQIIPAKITSTSPIKATPIKTGNGSGWSTDSTLSDFQVYTSDGSTPTLNAFGMVVVGSETGAQNPLFFQGGGNALKWFKITQNNADGTYNADQYDHPRGSTTGTSVTGMIEANLAPAVPVAAWVRASLENDGKWYFSLPLGC